MQKQVYEFISKQLNDPIVERRICSISDQEFAIYQSDIEFLDKISPTFAGKKYSISLPTLCPDERQRRRLSLRNERNLYYRDCDKTGKKTISMYSPESPYKVYDKEVWRSDDWNAMDYGQKFDSSISFFEQFNMLMRAVPHCAMNMANDNVNSQYTNYSVSNKNVYLSFGPTENEDCMYGKFINKCKDCIDCLSTYKCELCYEGYDSVNCYQCMYFTNSTDCDNCLMIENCSGCKHCIGCVGLVHKEYYYLNTYVGKEKYEEIKKQLFPLTDSFIQQLEEKIIALKNKLILPYANIQKSEYSYGDMLVDNKNAIFCFDMVNTEYCKYSWFAKNSIWSQDNVFNDPTGIEYCYETCSTLSQHCAFVFFTFDSRDTYYCVECFNCQNIFGCVGLRNRQYCIFNIQYTKEEYEQLVSQIIDHMIQTKEWGEYFPISNSPYCYNESVAQEYFPLNKQEALARNYQRKDQLITINLPENVKSLEASILKQDPTIRDRELCDTILLCKKSGRPFRILPGELEFYKKLQIGIPTLHMDERYSRRMKRKPGKELHLRKCDKCGIEIVSIYSQSYKGKVYCNECYVKEVY